MLLPTWRQQCNTTIRTVASDPTPIHGASGRSPGRPNTTARHGASPQIGRHIQTAEATSDRPGRPRPPNAVHRFRFEDADIRIILIDSEPWFVAADVCRALQLASHKGSYGAHLDKLDPDEKKQIDRQIAVTITPGGHPGVLAEVPNPSGPGSVERNGRTDEGPTVWAVSESGLYTLILRCRDATTPGT